MKRFDITYFFGPTSEYIVQEECIRDMKESGITLCQLLWNDTETKKKALPLLKKYGMDATVYDHRIMELYLHGEPGDADAVVKEVVEDYAPFDNILEWGICDEPHSGRFPVLAAIVEAFHKYSPDKETVINLYPDYSTPKQLRDVDYESYLNNFVTIVQPDFLSYDYYHFLGRESRKQMNMEGIDEREKLIRLASQGENDRDGFFGNLAEIRRVGLENNLEQMLIVLLTEHGNYRNLTREEILWEVNMCLVYGMHRISYFTYWQPKSGDDYWHWTNSMCDREGNKYQHYYEVQSINQDIKTIGERLFETKSEQVFHIGKQEKGTTMFESYGAIQAIEGENAVIGFFEDGCMYLVNRDYKQENTFTIYATEDIWVYRKEAFDKCGKQYTVTLPAGAGSLIKVNR